MSDAVQIALIATITPTIVALAGVIVSLINGRKTDKVGVKIDEVHKLANSRLTDVTAQLDTARGEITQMREVINTFIQDKKTKPK